MILLKGKLRVNTIVLYAFLLLFSLSAYSTDCAEVFARIHERISTNSFITDRGLIDYKDAFGTAFTRQLLQLRKQDQWIDSGAGKAHALLDYIEQSERAGNVHAKTTAIAYAMPEEAKANIQEASATKKTFRYLVARYLEKIPAKEIGNTKLITDFFGPLAYSTRADLVLNKYLAVLETEGKIFSVLGYRTSVKENNEVMGFADWVAKKLPAEEFNVDITNNGFTIEKIKKSSYRFPPLKIVNIDGGAPPSRAFQVCEGPSC